jgi:hypothetical protein
MKDKISDSGSIQMEKMTEKNQVLAFSNKNNSSVRYNNYHFVEKTKGKVVCSFRR